MCFTFAKEIMFSSFCLFVCLSVCLLATLRKRKKIETDFHEIFREN